MHNTLYVGVADGSGKKRGNRAGYSAIRGTGTRGTGTRGTGTRGTDSVGARRRLAGALVTVAVAAIVVLAGCDDAGDTTAPTVSDTSFTATAAGATVSITVNKAGKLFWVVYANETTAPADAAALITDAGKDKTAPIIANSGSAGQAVTAAGVQTVSVSNLPNGTDYDFYAVAQDAAGNASVLSAKTDVRIALAQAVTAGTITLASGQISIPITNSNTGAVRVGVGIDPAKADATYTIGGTAFSNAATTGFALATSATQTLTIGNLTDGTAYTVSLTTVGSNGVAHSSAVRRSVALSAPTAFMITATNGTVTNSAPNIMVTLSWTNPSNATTVALGALPAGATASPATPNTAAGASNSVAIGGF